jgi:hypothetical protein
MKCNRIETTYLNENLINKSKTVLFELDDDSTELILPEDGAFDSLQRNNKSHQAKIKKLNGKWVVVNGNFIKTEQNNPNIDLSNFKIFLVFSKNF